MKVCLVGYPGSQCIVKASKYLTDKYLDWGFDIRYVNYTGEINGWATFLSGYLTAIKDKYIILSLDDYLVASFMDMEKYMAALTWISDEVVSVKLCHSTPEEHEEYPVTTQYTIWDREYLIDLLNHVHTPWQFEIDGSILFKRGNKKTLHVPCLEYFTNSSISSRWEGIKLDGLNDEDINHIKQNLL